MHYPLSISMQWDNQSPTKIGSHLTSITLLGYLHMLVIQSFAPGHHRGTSLHYPFLLPFSNNGTTSRQHGSTTREDTRNKRRMFALLSEALQQHRPHKKPYVFLYAINNLAFCSCIDDYVHFTIISMVRKKQTEYSQYLAYCTPHMVSAKPLYPINDNLMQPFMLLKSSFVLIIKQALESNNTQRVIRVVRLITLAQQKNSSSIGCIYIHNHLAMYWGCSSTSKL